MSEVDMCRHIRVLCRDSAARTHGDQNINMAKNNEITTSRYNALTFIPQALFEQFRRIANLYFLVLGVVMLVGQYTGVYDTSVEPISCLTPLAIVLAFSMFKEGYEDLGRHKADRAVNNRTAVTISSEGGFLLKRWKDLTVGDLVLAPPDEEIPADMVLLTCAERGSSSGTRQAVGYVETSSIDGETNLKIKLPLSWMIAEHRYEDIIFDRDLGLGSQLEGIDQFKGLLAVEHPNKNIHCFNGSVTLDCEDVTHPVSEKNFLLRGSILRCSSWAIGVCVYTGKDTKVSLNAKKPPSKLSMVDRIVNQLLWVVLSMMLAVCIVSTILSLLWKHAHYSADYLCLDEGDKDTASPNGDGGCTSGDTSDVLMFFTFATLFNNFVCISMYITLEVVYYLQAVFISSDLDMYCPLTDSPAEARTSNMNSDLGQVQYIFSDKTGTLTKNSMMVRRVSVEGVVFGAPLGTNVDESVMTANTDACDLSSIQHSDLSTLRDSHPQYVWHNTGRLKGRAWGPKASTVTQEMLLVMSVCNTVLITPPADFSNSGESDARVSAQMRAELQQQLPRGSALCEEDLKKCIQAESADETALVLFAASEGDALLCNRTLDEILLLCGGELLRLPLLAVNEFDSVRKRMSVIVRWKGTALMLCKGADSSVFSSGVMDHSMLLCQDHVGTFSRNGLRTLVFARRYISEEELGLWLPKYNDALNAVHARSDRLLEVANLIETKLEVLGCVGIEDELQDDVQHSIRTLHKAGIKLWMLTGDKAETAISVAKACSLISQNADVERLLSIKDRDELSNRLDDIQAVFCTAAGRKRLPRQCVLLDGESLTTAQSSDVLEEKFVNTMRNASVVVVARVSPLQKAFLVRMIKKRKDAPVTLSIGDGANDVSMIHEANIGVGINGREGRHAANNADFAVAQFRFLVPLLLVHGRFDYLRSSKVVLYSFYKNLVLVSVLFFYCYYNGWSGTSLLESMVYSGYNFYLGLPVVAIGVFDQDVPKSYVLSHPKLAYASGLFGEILNLPTMTRWTLMAFFQGLIIFGLSFRCLGNGKSAENVSYDITASNGRVEGLYGDGYVVYTCVVFAMQIKIASMTCSWTVWNGAAWILSFVGYFGFTLLYGLFPEVDEWYMVPQHISNQTQFWLIVLLVVVVFGLVDWMTEASIRHAFPTADHVLRVMHSDHLRLQGVPQPTLSEMWKSPLESCSPTPINSPKPTSNLSLQHRPQGSDDTLKTPLLE